MRAGSGDCNIWLLILPASPSYSGLDELIGPLGGGVAKVRHDPNAQKASPLARAGE
jgi:hypothetical protein